MACRLKLRGNGARRREDPIHEARKSIKQVRVLSRLIQDELGRCLRPTQHPSARDGVGPVARCGRAFDGAAPQLLLEAISDEETNLRKRAFYIGGKVYREKSAPVRSHAPQSMEIATAIGAPEPDAAASFGEGGTTTSRLH